MAEFGDLVAGREFGFDQCAEWRGKLRQLPGMFGRNAHARDEKAKAQITESMPELRSRVLMLLSNRLPESLVTTEDKTKLAEEILATLDKPLSADQPAQGITSVSFNTFVVQ